VDKIFNQNLGKFNFLAKTKNLVNLLDTFHYNIITNLFMQAKKINDSYYTIISTGVNKKLDQSINVCYNSQNQEAASINNEEFLDPPKVYWGKRRPKA
jgi:hypothetical protein